MSYYDIRAAQNAMRALHGRLLRGRKLDIHYHIPKVLFHVPIPLVYVIVVSFFAFSLSYLRKNILLITPFFLHQENSKKENTSEGALLVHNLDSSVSNEEFYRIVSSYGEIREVLTGSRLVPAL